jgi:hypothetical protein
MLTRKSVDQPENPDRRMTMTEQPEMHVASSTVSATLDARRDAVTAAALVLIRRAFTEGVPVTRSRLADEASVTLGASPEEALQAVDAEAQRLGVSSLR